MIRKIMLRFVCVLLAMPVVGQTTLNGAGATFPYPMYSKWFSEYHKVHSDVQVNYQSIGSGGGIRQVTAGDMTYVLPDRTVIYKPGDFFFESGDINHTVFNKTDAPMVHLLFEILPADLSGPSLIAVRHH